MTGPDWRLRLESTLVEEPDGGVHLIERLDVPAAAIATPVPVTEYTAKRVMDAFLLAVPRTSIHGVIVRETDTGCALFTPVLRRPLLILGPPETYVLDSEARARAPILGGSLVKRGHEHHGFLEFGIAPGRTGGLDLMSRAVGYYPRFGGTLLRRWVFRAFLYRFHVRHLSRGLKHAWRTICTAQPVAEDAASARDPARPGR